ncbi:MAG: hypothetical protein AAAC47_07670 [Pararhizobium sp.]
MLEKTRFDPGRPSVTGLADLLQLYTYLNTSAYCDMFVSLLNIVADLQLLLCAAMTGHGTARAEPVAARVVNACRNIHNWFNLKP